MEVHMEEHHKGNLFPKDDMEDKGYTSVKNEKWTRFMKESNVLIEQSPNFKSHDSGREWEQKSEKEVFQNIMEHCDVCKETFNTKNSFEDHAKVHNTKLEVFKCQQCKEAFFVESVFNNHLKSHKILYSKLNTGILICNGCSQHFQRNNIN